MVPSGTVGTAPRDEFELTGHCLEGRYDVERVVAAGGFGVVYFGRHHALHSPVAVKVLRAPTNLSEAEQEDFARRFLEEARTVATLQHPAVVRALDFGVATLPRGVRAPWMALEWVEGETLKDRLDARAEQPMAPAQVLALLRPVLEALAAAHRAGVAHRDIKPANIMLPRAQSGAMPSRILDFGIAKTMESDEEVPDSGETNTRSQLVGFSQRYASPEQLTGMRTGPWTDVHALALVITETLTGRKALAGQDVIELTACALRPDRPTPRARGVDAGPWEQVLARALALKPAARFRDAGELLAALEASVPSALKPVGEASAPPPDDASGPIDVALLAESTLRPSQIPALTERPRRGRSLAIAAALAGAGVIVAVSLAALQHARRPELAVTRRAPLVASQPPATEPAPAVPTPPSPPVLAAPPEAVPQPVQAALGRPHVDRAGGHPGRATAVRPIPVATSVVERVDAAAPLVPSSETRPDEDGIVPR